MRRRRRIGIVFFVAAAVVIGTLPVPPETGPLGSHEARAFSNHFVTEQISVNSAEEGQNDGSRVDETAVSFDGRYVAFVSSSTNLVPDDTNARSDIFVRDRYLGTTTRASLQSDGSQFTCNSNYPAMSADARFVVFECGGLRVRDQQTNTTSLVAGEVPYTNWMPDISADGRFVVYGTINSPSPQDTNITTDIYLIDRDTDQDGVYDESGATARSLISVGAGGAAAGNSQEPSISADGRYVAFTSTTAITADDPNGTWDAFVRDVQSGTTTLVSRGSSGEYGSLGSPLADISDDGQAVAFSSDNEFFPEYEPPGYEWSDVFVRFWRIGVTVQASYREGDNEANTSDNAIFERPSVSADGRFVTFHWQPGSVWLRDLAAPFAAIVSLDNAGAPVPGLTYGRQISGNGETVVFESEGAFLPGDTGDPDIFARDWGLGAIPPGQAGGAPGDQHTDGGAPGVGDPVNPVTGEFVTSTLDAKLPGIGLPFGFVRTYASGDTTPGPLGEGWTHSYAVALQRLWNGDVRVQTEWGRTIEFHLKLDGTYAAGRGVRDVLVRLGDGSYRLTRRDQVVYALDAEGRLTSLRERNGQGLTFTYTAGNLTTITDSVGRQVTLSYTNGRLTQLALPDGRSVGYGYTSGLLTSVTDLRQGVTTYAYDAGDRLNTVTDQNNHLVVDNDYGPDGRVIRQEDALNHVSTFAWDPTTGTATFTDARNNAWRYIHEGNLLRKIVLPGNDTTTFEYDANFNITKVTDARGNAWTMTYDARGNMLTRTAPGASAIAESWTYTARNDVDTYTDPRGFVFDFGYDAAGNVTTLSAPESSLTQFGRDPTTGLVETLTDPNGKVWTYDYDAEGKLLSVVGPRASSTWSYAYDASDRLRTIVEPRGNEVGSTPADYAWTLTYDDADNVVTRTSPLGHVTTTGWDPAGNLDFVRDPKNRTTDYVYDAADRLTDVIAPGGATTHYGYDGVGNITSRTDAENRTWAFGYNVKNLVTSITSPMNRTWSFTWSKTGTIKTKTVPSGGSITYNYDELDRLIEILYSATSTPDVVFTYDKNSNLTRMNDGESTNAVYAYDDLNRLLSVTRGTNVFSYVYDPAGNVTKRTYPANVAMNYTYHDDGLLKTVSRGTNTTTYGYDAAANQTTATLPSGNGHVESRAWDRDGRLISVTHTKGSTTLASFTATLDEVGKPTAIATNTGTTSYGYDPQRDFLTEVCYQASCPNATDPFIRYTYNDVGNRLTEVRATGTTTYTYNADDRLTSKTAPSGTTNFTYNANGDMTGNGTRSYTWDLESRMRSTTSGTTTHNYTYDGLGRRLKWTRGTNDSQITKFLWDENSAYPLLAVERDGADALLRRYVYGMSLVSMRSGTADFYFHLDRLGSVSNVTSSTGAKQWSYIYEPFGDERSTTKHVTSAPVNNLQFTGEYLDNAANHYYLRARYYSPTNGRFYSLDPYPANVLLPHLSPYAYVGNVPTVFTDPTGECFVICGVVGGIVGAATYGVRVAFDDNIGFSWKGLGVNTAAGVLTGFTGGAASAMNFGYFATAALGSASNVAGSILTSAACGGGLPSVGQLAEDALVGAATSLFFSGLSDAAPVGSILRKDVIYKGRHVYQGKHAYIPPDYISPTVGTWAEVGEATVDVTYSTATSQVGSTCK